MFLRASSESESLAGAFGRFVGLLVQDTTFYTGEVRWGVPHGIGRMNHTEAIGEIYEGQFVRGKRKGSGKLQVKHLAQALFQLISCCNCSMKD